MVEKFSNHLYPILGEVLPIYLHLQSVLYEKKVSHNLRSPKLAITLLKSIVKLDKYLKSKLFQIAAVNCCYYYSAPILQTPQLQALGWTVNEWLGIKKISCSL